MCPAFILLIPTRVSSWAAVIARRIAVIAILLVVPVWRWQFAAMALISSISGQAHALVEPEIELGFGGNIEFFATRQHLRAGSCGSTNDRADRSAFSAPGQRAEQRTCECTAAYVLTGALVHSQAASLAASRGAGAFGIHTKSASVHFDRAQIKRQVTSIVAGLHYGKLGMRTPRNYDIAAGVGDVP